MKKMPPLHHTIPGHDFALDKSEVIQWLISEPAAQKYLFDRANASGAIVYDSSTGTWRGIDYGD